MVQKKGGGKYEPDHEWVQCDKCRKWRILPCGFDATSLPPEWFVLVYPDLHYIYICKTLSFANGFMKLYFFDYFFFSSVSPVVNDLSIDFTLSPIDINNHNCCYTTH